MALLLLLPGASFSQISGIWHSSQYDHPFTDYTMKLKGPVKIWMVKRSNGERRTMTFDKNGNIESDTYKGAVQTFVPPEFSVIQMKKRFEKPHPAGVTKDSTLKYNQRRQLLERRAGGFMEKNIFNAAGQILIHWETNTYTETGVWNSIHHESPTYTYTVKTGMLAVYRYNKTGLLTQAEYFHADPFMNLKMTYEYDSSNRLVQASWYDRYNISVSNMPDNYLYRILLQGVDTGFSIDRFFSNYWGQGTPLIYKWKFNSRGQKTEHWYEFRNAINFKTYWEYDKEGFLKRETFYDILRNRPQNIIDFDRAGNVIKEVRPGYNGLKNTITEMTITYWR
jgi:hypothetical protein